MRCRGDCGTNFNNSPFIDARQMMTTFPLSKSSVSIWNICFDVLSTNGITTLDFIELFEDDNSAFILVDVEVP